MDPKTNYGAHSAHTPEGTKGTTHKVMYKKPKAEAGYNCKKMY